uniref:Cation_ATPase_C domain-containing protein n=1 Tax=Loa loa TaxID=7209 RepID=A0A1I7VAJ6_LOALO
MTSSRQEVYTGAQPMNTMVTTMTKTDDGQLQNRPFKGILFGQTFLLIFAGIAVCFTFIFFIVFLFQLHETHLDFWPWKISVLGRIIVMILAQMVSFIIIVEPFMNGSLHR